MNGNPLTTNGQTRYRLGARQAWLLSVVGLRQIQYFNRVHRAGWWGRRASRSGGGLW